MIDDILVAGFAIATLGHGLAHAVAAAQLVGQLTGRAREAAIPVRAWLLPSLSSPAAAGLALVFWLPAAIGFVLAAPAMLAIVLDDLAWSPILVGAALLSAAGVILFGAVWPGGELRLRPLHVFLALAMDAVILVTQLVLGWPEA